MLEALGEPDDPEPLLNQDFILRARLRLHTATVTVWRVRLQSRCERREVRESVQIPASKTQNDVSIQALQFDAPNGCSTVR